ncbi:Uncharacterized protein OS=Pirellula staleyi (strain ATCC 27377 / DSM 6068 / ICPB 4128) GN=Psta_3621 PE=4 SV=1 [Gemmataceae bacterium]|nr:Uncharacterized protein OS=Pirellula staleyi (strain ATCC 27377 / DSM 6068 / ICPB 4128) GN=Psta_3621 PE=4 SV=1 [Gemmataceae bacterium]VTT97983.1 Uncharacterized protein OS=Pirellula staleyi (strain ATCC 27377 / DSM 6068 / ICPB 4128) GN=Psta_3621 PE=4 SV=1 [Gemmataceae bacterium]
MAGFLVCLALGVAFVLVVVRDIAAFREHFPPISDAEFLARCKPGTNPEVALKVRRIVADHFAVEYERIHPDTSFVDDLGAD